MHCTDINKACKSLLHVDKQNVSMCSQVRQHLISKNNRFLHESLLKIWDFFHECQKFRIFTSVSLHPYCYEYQAISSMYVTLLLMSINYEVYCIALVVIKAYDKIQTCLYVYQTNPIHVFTLLPVSDEISDAAFSKTSIFLKKKKKR